MTTEPLFLLKETEKLGIDFFVVGLPRCRLAWIANYLSYDNMECHFDAFAPGLNGAGPDVISKLENFQKIIGVADGAAVMFQDKLVEQYPYAKWVVITRNYNDICNSLKTLGVPVDTRLSTLNYKIGELRSKLSPLVVPFESLDKSIQDVAMFVNSDWKNPQWRHDQLVRLNVQSKFTKDDLVKIPAVNPLSIKAEAPSPTLTQETYFKLLQEICGDDKLAYRWLYQVIHAATIMDHVIDNDPIDYEQFDAIMKGVLLEWGVNDFYKRYAPYLAPVMSASISAWQHSAGDMKRIKHYDIYTEVPCAVAFVLGGQEKVDKFSPRLRELANQLLIEDTKRDS